MRTLRFGFFCCGEVFRGSVTLPAEYFDALGVPLWNKLNNRFSSPVILWDKPIGPVPVDAPPQTQPTIEELRKLHERLVLLEQKFNGVLG